MSNLWKHLRFDFDHDAGNTVPRPCDLPAGAYRPERPDAKPLVVAYATAETEDYVRALGFLGEDCKRLDLDSALFRVVPPKSKKPLRRRATHLKVHVIRHALKATGRPVWYFDCDTKLLAEPPEVHQKFAAAFHRQESRDKLGYPIRSSMMFFRPRSETFEFLDLWQEAHNPDLEDHTPLCRVWKTMPRLVRRAWHTDFSGFAQNDATPCGLRSACCGGTAQASGRSTQWYRCNTCGEACDLAN